MLRAWKRVCYKTDVYRRWGIPVKRIWIPLCFILGFAMLAHSLYFWGGLVSTQEVGGLVRERTSTFSFIAWCYITSGQGILEMGGWQEAAIQYAQNEVGGVFAVMKQTPQIAMDTLFKEIPYSVKLSYYGGPLLLLVGMFLQLRKPKTFKTFG